MPMCCQKLPESKNIENVVYMGINSTFKHIPHMLNQIQVLGLLLFSNLLLTIFICRYTRCSRKQFGKISSVLPPIFIPPYTIIVPHLYEYTSSTCLKIESWIHLWINTTTHCWLKCSFAGRLPFKRGKSSSGLRLKTLASWRRLINVKNLSWAEVENVHVRNVTQLDYHFP